MDPAPPPEDEIESDPAAEKPGFFSSLDPRTQRSMIIIGVVALVVGLVGGFAAGFKVEQNRVKSDVKKAAKAAKVQKITRLAGVITATESDAFTIADTQGLHVKVLTPGNVVLQKTVKGSASDIHTGGEILLRGKNVSDGVVNATEIIVLPTGSNFGGLSVAKAEGNKFTIAGKDGKKVTVNLTPTSAVYTLQPAKKTEVTKDGEVVIRGSGLAGKETFTGADVIILPAGSGFASS